jgi:hypothetical protein
LAASIDKIIPVSAGEDVDSLRCLADLVEQKAIEIGAIEPNDA